MLEKTIESLLNELEKKFITSLGSASAFTDRLVGKKHCASAIRQLIKEELEEKSRELKNIYDKYSHLDQCLSDKFWCGESLQAQMQNEFWIAIKNSKTAIAEYLGEGEKNSNA